MTIRNLSDEVVEALKKRAKRNGRSMEAEIREALNRLAVDDEPQDSGLEKMLEERSRPRRWYTTTEEIETRIAANPPTEQDLRVAAEWVAENEASRKDDEDDLRDPWEHAEQLRRQREEAKRST